jgi:hypothetical protein
VPERLGILILAEGAVLGIVLAALGILRVIREGAALKTRVVNYAHLPLRDDLSLCRRRLAIGERALDSTSRLRGRLDRAVAEFRTDGLRMKMMVTMAVRIARKELRL